MAYGIAPVQDGTIMVAGVGTTGGVQRFLTLRMTGEPVGDWLDNARDWNQGTNAFGACLKGTTSATAAWTTNACGMTDGAHWNDTPQAAEQVAFTAGPQAGATATFRFGVRFSTSRRPGRYVAPVAFTVVAPA